MKMTTEIPPGITTPDSIETRLGDLNFFDGVPDAETVQKVYNFLDFQHAYQAYMGGIKIASMDAIRNGILEFGPANTTAVLFEDLMDSKALFLTANTTSVYMFSWLQLDEEPMVIETPPDVLGIIDDHWCCAKAGAGRSRRWLCAGGTHQSRIRVRARSDPRWLVQSCRFASRDAAAQRLSARGRRVDPVSLACSRQDD